MSIITLTTDFGDLDYYVASIKGSILNLNKEVDIIDITHKIKPFNLNEAAYILVNAYRYFPKNTVHIITVDSYYHKQRKYIVAKVNEHYFVTTDNGVLSLMFPNIHPESLHEITLNNRFDDMVAFTPVDIFVPVAVHLSSGGVPDLIGRRKEMWVEKKNPQFFFNEVQKMLVGKVMYIDCYGNAVTNITKDIFEKYNSVYQSFTVRFRNLKIEKIYAYPTEMIENWDSEKNVESKEYIIFNQARLLEIAIYKGTKESGASSLMGLGIGEKVFVEFSD